MPAKRKGIAIGQLLIEQGVLTDHQVAHILSEQKSSHRPFGDLAERIYGVDPKVVEDAWVEQYVQTAGLTDLDEIEFDRECLRVLNRRQAWQFHLLPVNHDVPQVLNMATDSQNLIRAVNFSSRRIDEAIYMLVAERSQLRDFLMKHYPVPQCIAEYSERLAG
jgi:Type II secretion system (T2SS), protein E, N-terminal domain